MEQDDIIHFTALLNEEKKLLERELGSIGEENRDQPDGWEGSLHAVNTETAEIEGRASEISEFEDRNAVTSELSHRLSLVISALSRVLDGSYGVCSICGNTIEKARLSANPAAYTCKTHRES